MLENRSFDNLLGYQSVRDPRIDGINVARPQTNPENCSKPDSVHRPVRPNGRYSDTIDPGHEVTHVNVQLFCTRTPAPNARARNQGFIKNYTSVASRNLTTGVQIMDCFDPAAVPVISALASQFRICDRWFSSVPGPTWPNRFFAHCGTSDGVAAMGFRWYVRKYNMPTVYESLEAAGRSWRIYFHDFPQALALRRLRSRSAIRSFSRFREFADDCRRGKLADYTFIEPRYFNSLLGHEYANDQHPPHDVRFGEELVKNVYEAIRSSPEWGSVLLIVVYDEHGGYYDHVAPPDTVSPDGKESKKPRFDFKRLGLRVPAIVVSAHVPSGIAPDHTEYEHSSLLATARKYLGAGQPLTPRDARSPAIDTKDWLASDNPREDAPERLPSPDWSENEVVGTIERARALTFERNQTELSEFQASLLALARSLVSRDVFRTVSLDRELRREEDAGQVIQSVVEQVLPAPVLF